MCIRHCNDSYVNSKLVHKLAFIGMTNIVIVLTIIFITIFLLLFLVHRQGKIIRENEILKNKREIKYQDLNDMDRVREEIKKGKL